jgi:hypothetical protein
VKRWLVMVALAACGRVGFEARSGPGGDGGGGDDGGGLPGDGPNAGANRAFVTAGTVTGATLGGLAGADAVCQDEAKTGGLSGTYLAFLSSSTTAAHDRFAASRGWVRPDGEPLFDTIDDLLAGKLFMPLDLDASGTTTRAYVLTGTGLDGKVDTNYTTCNDWTGGTGPAMAGTTEYPPPDLIYGNSAGCTMQQHLYCLEVGHSVAVAPHAVAGRIAFLSKTAALSGIAGLDNQCESDAVAAGLPAATYIAAVATTTTTILSRITTDARPWIRVDGTQITTDGASLFGSGYLMSYIDQDAAGSYLNHVNTWTGASAPNAVGTTTTTCADWMTSGFNMPDLGQPIILQAQYVWYVAPNLDCSAMRVLCLQQ